ncbi:MAG TPA: PAS domain S-box protein [Steroidobacteraceae bacterium]|nr:PAS domain S-box protein [Steroidobacteraceae bacterium]
MYSRDTQALMEAAVDAIVVIDHHGHIQNINQATRDLFGYRDDELLGENVSMLMPEPDRSAHDAYIARYLATGEPHIIGIGREVVACRKDGSTFPVRLSVGRVPDSTPPRFVGLLRDITAERAANAALKLQRDRAQAFLELHDSILLELDAARRVREINARGAELLGAPAEEIVARDWLVFMYGEAERERARHMLDDALASGASREREFDCRDATGAPRRIYWRCIALRDAEGQPAGWLCSGADVTERHRREQEAHLAQDRLTRVARLATMGEMAAGVAHELNQPLTAITTYARACERYLAMDQPDLAEVNEAVREIHAEGQRAGEIIRRLRQMVRVDAPDERAPIDVNAALVELRSLLLSDARAHDAQLSIRLAPDLPCVEANAVHVQQVVLNLVRNALEAVQDRPAGSRRVELSTTLTASGDVEIRVADNGPGIDPGIADRLFDPFSTTKRAGTGLGLAISRTIIQSHGGSIGTRTGTQGADFYVHLPAA